METDSYKLEAFNKLKEATLCRADLSRKGSIDEPILQLVNAINGNQYYYTTSTCSGRITIIDKPHGNSGIKKGSNFLLNSHEQVDFTNLLTLIQTFKTNSDIDSLQDRCLWLKFEPFIMHIQCLNLDRARLLVNTALASGCRNSGITLGKPDKYMVAIRSTSGMEIPISCGSRFTIEDNYLRFLCEESNRRFEDNALRLTRLQEQIAILVRDDKSTS